MVYLSISFIQCWKINNIFSFSGIDFFGLNVFKLVYIYIYIYETYLDVSLYYIEIKKPKPCIFSQANTRLGRVLVCNSKR